MLSVPLAAVGDGQRYNYENRDGRSPDYYDLTGATLNILACAPEATGGNLRIYFTTQDRVDSADATVALASLTGGFETISVPVPDESEPFDPSKIMVTRIEVEAGSDFGDSWQTPATLIYLDRIWTSNGLFDDTFDESFNEWILSASGAHPLAGATMTWLSSLTWGGGTGADTGDGGDASG